MRKCDILIIGSGIAGASVALELEKKGFDIVVLAAGDSNTAFAQGGIVYSHDPLLAHDIEDAGAGLCNRKAVEQLVQLGPSLVEKFLIEEVGVPFDRNPDGSLSFALEGAHSSPCILHCKDQTGKAIATSLHKKIKQSLRIEYCPGKMAIDLITLSHHSKTITDIYLPSTCVGAYVFDPKKGQVDAVFARETILATGGIGEVFLHTTNPLEARGDGIAMAFRAGARIMNMEYVQFHPTALYIPGERRFLLSEALRGEGARLLNVKLEPFMQRYDDRGDLAPRDVVSRAIFTEMVQSSADHLWLDISHKSKEWLCDRFPSIFEYCLEKGFNLSKEPVPIVPAAHYSCGGIAADLQGRTSIHRLRALGEVSCTGLHGANRLASTSLLEGLVWAHTAAADLASSWKERKDYFPPVENWQMRSEKADGALIRQDWMAIKQTMWNYVGLVRDSDRLRRALKMLRELQWEIDSFYEKAALTSDLIGLRNGVLTALLITQGAWRNKRSLGCHYRIS